MQSAERTVENTGSVSGRRLSPDVQKARIRADLSQTNPRGGKRAGLFQDVRAVNGGMAASGPPFARWSQ
jgi:hypothetical protein